MGSRRDELGRFPRESPDWVVALGFEAPLVDSSTTGASTFQACCLRGSCDWCQTDYQTDIQRNEEDGSGWSITVTVYSRLGEGRSLTDPAWKNFASRCPRLKNYLDPVVWPRRRDTAFPRGTVEEAWLRSEAREV